MEYKTGRTPSYRFTISFNDLKDMEALKNLRESISSQNKIIRENRKTGWTAYWYERPILRVKVQLRRPELNHPLTISEKSRGTKYLRGGSVRKSQLPTQADVYILHRRD